MTARPMRKCMYLEQEGTGTDFVQCLLPASHVGGLKVDPRCKTFRCPYHLDDLRNMVTMEVFWEELDRILVLEALERTHGG